MTEEAPLKKWPQFLVLILCNISVLTFGLQAGWLSPLQPSLQSENSPLGLPPLTVEQISWIGSLPSVSLILASPLFGFCLNRYGRKITCLIATAPNLIHYALLLFASDVYIIYVARLIGGFCSCGGFIMAPIYINETSEPRLRGLLGGLTGFIIKVGIILSFIFGGYTSYLTLNLVSISFTIFFLLLYIWLPESPVYLVTINKREEAKKVLEKLRGPNDKLIEKELDDIEHMIIESHKNNDSFSMRDFFKSRATVKGLIIVCGVYTFQMMCGYPAIVRYAVDIFQNSATVFSPNLAAIMVALSQLLSSFVGASLIDKLGRKSILMISTFSMSVTLIVFSGYMLGRTHLENSEYSSVFRFVPTVTLILFICSYASGYGSVPFVILPELFAPESRAKAASISNIWISFIEFLVVKMFPTFSYWIGLAPTLLIFAGHCMVGLIFYRMVMFETKGLDYQTIYRMLNSKKGKANVLENEMLKPLSSDSELEKQVAKYKSGGMA